MRSCHGIVRVMTDDATRSADGPAAPVPTGPQSPLPGWTLPDMSKIDPEILESLVTHVARVTPEGRRKAAQDPATRMYLQAGLRLLEQQVVAGDEDPAPGESASLPHPFLAWMSRSRIAAETTNEPEESGLPRKGTAAGLRDRWEPHSDFISDILQVALTGDTWGKALSGNDALWRALAEQSDFPGVIEEVAYLGVTALEASAGFRVQLLAIAMAQRDAQVQASLQDLYGAIIRNRVDLLRQTLEARGLALRPGMSFELLSEFLSAMTEGLAIRLVVDPQAPVIDHDSRNSLLGLGALAVMVGSIDFDGDGLSLREFLHRSFSPRDPALG